MIVAYVKAIAGILVLMTFWLAVQTYIRKRMGWARQRDVLEDMIHGCDGCAEHGCCPHDNSNCALHSQH